MLHEIGEDGKSVHYSPYDGKVHPGDYFTSVSCSINSSCSGSLAALTATKLAAGATTLP